MQEHSSRLRNIIEEYILSCHFPRNQFLEEMAVRRIIELSESGLDENTAFIQAATEIGWMPF